MIRRFFRDSAIYVIPTLLSRGMGFLLLPVYTHYLSPADYGAVEFLAVFFAILNLVLPLEVSQAVARLLPEARAGAKSTYASTAFWFTCGVFFLFLVVAWFFPASMSALIFGDNTLKAEVRLGSVSMLFGALFYLLQNQLRFTSQVRAYAFCSMLFSVVMAVVSVILVVKYEQSVMGVIWGQLTGSLCAVMAGLYATRAVAPVHISFDVARLKEMLVFSAPLVLSGIAVYCSLYADRWVLRELMGIDEVGIYSVAYRVATTVALVFIAFQMSLTPLVYASYRNPETPCVIGRIFSYFLLLVLPLLLAISMFSTEIVGLFTAVSFHEAARLIPWLAIAVLLMNVYVFSPGLGIAKKTGTVAMINVLVAVVNFSLNMLLIPVFGLIGAAAATLIAGGMMAGLYFWLGNREYAVVYRKWRCFLACLLTLLSIYFFSGEVLSWQVRAFFVLLFSGMLLLILLPRDECRRIKKLFYEKCRGVG